MRRGRQGRRAPGHAQVPSRPPSTPLPPTPQPARTRWPTARTRSRQHDEPHQRHASRAGRQRHERASQRQQTSDEHRARPIPVQQPTPATEHRSSDREMLDDPRSTQAVREQRTDDVPSRGSQDSQRKAHPPLMDAEPREQQRHLARDRHARALRHHQQEHSEEPELLDHAGHDLPRLRLSTSDPNGAAGWDAMIRERISHLSC